MISNFLQNCCPCTRVYVPVDMPKCDRPSNIKAKQKIYGNINNKSIRKKKLIKFFFSADGGCDMKHVMACRLTIRNYYLFCEHTIKTQ